MTDDEKPKVHEPEGEETLIVEISRSLPLSQLTRGWKPQERRSLNRNEPEALGALYDALLRETLKKPGQRYRDCVQDQQPNSGRADGYAGSVRLGGRGRLIRSYHQVNPDVPYYTANPDR